MNLNRLFLEVLNESMPELLKEAHGSGVEFEEFYTDAYKENHYGGMNMFVDGQHVAYVEYTNVRDVIHIDDIKALVRGKGYGEALMKHLASIYGYENLNRGMLTPDGAKMRQKLDKHFNFDPVKHEESKNRHLNPSILKKIPNKVIRGFLLDLCKNGRQEAWATWMNNPSFKHLSNHMDKNYNFDFNEVGDVGEWVKGSVINDNDPEDGVPEFIEDYLAKIMTIK